MDNRRATIFAVAAATLTLAAGGPRAQQAPQTPQQTPAAAPAGAPTLAWQREVDAPGPISMTAGASLVFLAGPEAGLAAYSLSDGAEVWSSELPSTVAPVAFDSRVAVASGNAVRVVAADTGREVWTGALKGPAALLAFAGERVIAIGPTTASVWDDSGTLVREVPLGGELGPAPALQDQTIYAVVDGTVLVSVDLTTGSPRWRVTLPSAAASVVAVADRVFVSLTDGAFMAYHQTGEVAREWTLLRLGVIGRAVADERRVYFTFLDNTIRAFARPGGSLQWSSVLPTRPASGPVWIGDSLAVPLTTGGFVKVTADNGRLLPAGAPTEQQARLLDAAAAGMRVLTLTVVGDNTRTLAAWDLAGGS